MKFTTSSAFIQKNSDEKRQVYDFCFSYESYSVWIIIKMCFHLPPVISVNRQRFMKRNIEENLKR